MTDTSSDDDQLKDSGELANLIAAFRARFGTQPRCAGRAPGRVNLIGDHTDYCDGFAMPMAIHLQTLALAAPGAVADVVRVHSIANGETLTIPLEATPSPADDWGDYLRGIIAELQKSAKALPALDVLIAGNLPRGAGLSSSASLEIAFLLVVASLSGLSLTPQQRIAIARSAENDFAGMPCGVLDQYAVTMAESGIALLLDCRSQQATPVKLPVDPVVAVIDSGVRHQLTDGGYATRLAEARAAERLLGKSLRDCRLADIDRLENDLLRARAKHVISENMRVHRFARALQDQNWSQAGETMTASHTSLRDDYQVSCEVVDQLVGAARLHGALGARMTGGGFGGSVVALVPRTEKEAFAKRISQWQDDTKNPIHPVRWLEPAAGAELLTLPS